jgi:capsular polysaccharide biosynthesis protein
MQFAVTSLRENFEIQIWKNQFANGMEDSERSARIGITVSDTDPDRAYGLARELASVVVTTSQEQRMQMTTQLAKSIAELHDSVSERLDNLSREASEKQLAIDKATTEGKDELVQTLKLQLVQIGYERTSAEKKLSEIANSRDALADRITAAGLDLTISVIDERRGSLAQNHNFIVVMAGFVVAIAALIGVALIFGAFDPRIHDSDDVERLGLTILGHLPGFPGDQVGSLRARGASRARVPSFTRWRSHR